MAERSPVPQGGLGRWAETNPVEATAAIVAGSLGSLYAAEAREHLASYLKGEVECRCERCHACFGGDLRAASEWDFRYWHRMSPERRAGTLGFVLAAWEYEIPEQLASGLLYPSLYLVVDGRRAKGPKGDRDQGQLLIGKSERVEGDPSGLRD